MKRSIEIAEDYYWGSYKLHLIWLALDMESYEKFIFVLLLKTLVLC
jgi:hypothetical protein